MKNDKISVAQLSLPKGGGAIQGLGETFKADEFTGTASLSIPIPASPCRGFEPQLSLNYSSASGNGIFGLGFELALPVISRKTAQGIPQYGESDVFLLSQAEDLVPVGTAQPQQLGGIYYTVVAYRPRVEGLFARIEHWVAQEADKSHKSHWRVVGKDNVTSLFGNTPETRIEDAGAPQRIFQWLLSETFDALGNRTVYEYLPENTQKVLVGALCEKNRCQIANRYIKRIKYGNSVPFNEGIVPKDNAWHFEVVFDYGEHLLPPGQAEPYKETNPWQKRPDSFSTYYAGFEIRTHRLCRGILMFHRFGEIDNQGNPILVQATRFLYQEDSRLSLLKKVEHIGYRYENGSYQAQSLPPLEFAYTAFEPASHQFQPLLESGGHPMPGLDLEPDYRLVDLYGEGIPGILYSDGASVRYWEPERKSGVSDSKISYRRAGVSAALPIDSQRFAINPWLMDLTGNGRLDLLVNTQAGAGYYQVQPNSDWTPFRTFPSFPNDFHNPGNHLTDLTGNGLADLVLIDDEWITVYLSLGENGFKSPVGKRKNGLPVPKQDSATEVWQFADLFGTGTQHLIHIANGKVECWPSLGYGRFGKPVQLENAPRFDGELDASRLFLADLDGSGTLDLIYLHPDRVDIYFNRGGNAFDKEPTRIKLPATWDRLNQIRFADVYGNGNACLVFSDNHPEPRHWCYDFCGGQKPYLLKGIDNNLGAKTALSYRSSTQFYLDDKQKGVPWLGNLPFPVQVVEKNETEDLISGTRLVTTYAYRHGCYDGMEREFRGFGLVERRDAETLTTGAQSGDQTPVLTRTWYHTGVPQAIGIYTSASPFSLEGEGWDEGDINGCFYSPHPNPLQQERELDRIVTYCIYNEKKICRCLCPQAGGTVSQQFKAEYFQGDDKAYLFPDSVFDLPKDADTETRRQALRVLKGAVLRQEIAPATSPKQSPNAPYAVTETNYLVRLIQSRKNNDQGVFFVHARETISYDYERNPADPRVHHQFVLKVDDYGHVLRSCDVAYGRRPVDVARPVDEVLPEQLGIKMTVEQNEFINEEKEFRLLGTPKESKTYEVIKPPSLPAGSVYFSFETLESFFHNGCDISNACLLAWQQYYYWDTKKNSPYGKPGEVSPQALLARVETAEFSEKQIADAFAGAKSEGDLNKLLEGQGKYQNREKYWWNPGLTESYEEANKFYLPKKTTDAFQNATKYVYDAHCLLPIEVTDALENKTQAEIDYQTLQPWKITDINGNVSEVRFDPLGLVTVWSEYKPLDAGKNLGFRPLKEYTVKEPQEMQKIIAQPQDYLQDAKSYFHYDLFSWQQHKIPAHAVSLAAENYPEGNENRTGPIQIAVAYSDGFGRAVQTGMKVESGEANLIEGNVFKGTGETKNRWLISGRTHYNNKGLPIKQYEPYYLDGCRYVDNLILNRFGVSPTFHYDPLGRLVKTETPKGFFGEVEFTPWLERHYDENDTVVNSKYYGKHIKETADTFKWERQALEKAAKFYGTPDEKVLDNLGRVIQDIQILENQTRLVTHYQWDIQGNQLSSADPRLARSEKKNFETVYSMTGVALKTVSADAGTRWTLTNAIGNPIYGRDSRSFETYTRYDELHRPVEIRVKGGDGTEKLDRVVERMVYGDSQNAEIAKAKEKNLRGQLYLHYDQAGLLRIPLYNCMGLPLETSRQLLNDYKGEPNWRDTAEQALKRLLQTEDYSTRYEYDAMGRVTRETSPDGQATYYTYHRSGHLDQIRVDNDLYVIGTRYNAKGQRLRIEYGNGVATCYEYEPETFRLRRIKTTRQGTKLQDLNYTYDPVGNITHISDQAKDTVFNANQKVDPESDYTYDALYRLIQATGREHPGLSGERKRNGDFDGLSPPQIGDGQALWNYAQNFAYDDAGNLHRILHKGGSDWTHELTVSDRSNRAVDSRSTTKPDQVNDFFDANGNQLRLEGLAGIAWNYRDNIARATVIDRTGESKPSDAEYYVYDGGGSRIRKVTERYAKDSKTLNVEETIYLGSVEIKRIHQGIKVAANAKPTDSKLPLPAGEGRGEGMTVSTLVEERHSHRIMDGDRAIATRLHWTKGEPPAGVKNPQIRYQLENHLGSATLELDGEGQIISYEEYYPYGGTSLIMGRNQAEVKLKQYRYSGKERDCTGLYYYGFRYYAPWLGRWLSADPAGTVDGLNLYVYVGGNPITDIDIAGLCSLLQKRKQSSTSPLPTKTRKGNDGDEIKKYYVSEDAGTYKIHGRPEFDSEGKKIKVNAGTQDRRHVIGWDHVIKPSVEFISNFIIKGAGEQGFIDLAKQQYDELIKKGALKGRGKPKSNDVKEHIAYIAKKLNSTVGNLNPEAAHENQAIEHVRQQALSTLRNMAYIVEAPKPEEIKKAIKEGFKITEGGTPITDFANGIRRNIHEMVDNSGGDAVYLIRLLHDTVTSTGIDLNKEEGSIKTKKAEDKYETIIKSKSQTKFAFDYLNQLGDALNFNNKMSFSDRLKILFSLRSMPKAR